MMVPCLCNGGLMVRAWWCTGGAMMALVDTPHPDEICRFMKYRDVFSGIISSTGSANTNLSTKELSLAWYIGTSRYQ